MKMTKSMGQWGATSAVYDSGLNTVQTRRKDKTYNDNDNISLITITTYIIKLYVYTYISLCIYIHIIIGDDSTHLWFALKNPFRCNGSFAFNDHPFARSVIWSNGLMIYRCWRIRIRCIDYRYVYVTVCMILCMYSYISYQQLYI